MPDPVLICYVTCPDAGTAQAIARALVEARAAACVNILPRLQSVYRWQGHIETDDEWLLLIKTTEERFPAVRERVEALHPDELPEVIAVPVTQGSEPYMNWVRRETDSV